MEMLLTGYIRFASGCEGQVQEHGEQDIKLL